MTIYILQNSLTQRVLIDLKTICPDPNLTVDTYGRIIYDNPTMSSVGCQTMSALATHTSWIGIRGEFAFWSGAPDPNFTLHDRGGLTAFDVYPNSRVIDIVYNPVDCDGMGYFVSDINGHVTSMPNHVILFHELSHALRLITGTHDMSNPNTPEVEAINDENMYRGSIGLPLRQGIDGGCISGLLSKLIPPPDKRPVCFIADSTKKSTFESKVKSLRKLRDGVLRKTQFGEKFFSRYYEQYYKISPIIAESMKDNPQTMKLVRWSITYPIIQQLWLFQNFPEGSLKKLKKPWKSFLTELRNGLEDWTKEIELPINFKDMPTKKACEELGIIFRFVLRRPETRNLYLQRLEKLGQIPLVVGLKGRRSITNLLKSHGLSQQEVKRIVKSPRTKSSRTRKHSSGGMFAAIGNDHLMQFDTSQWFYTVTITNRTTDTFDEIALFYKRVNLPGVVYLGELNVGPSQTRIFNLGPCTQMESYAFGLRIGNDFVFQFPRDILGPGINMTPHLASVYSPSDVEPCADSWRIE